MSLHIHTIYFLCYICVLISPFNNANKSFNKNSFVWLLGCVLVGFLKFLKREKKEGLEDLDLPPAPPQLRGFEENMPEFPAFPEFPEEKISAKEEEMSKFEFLEKEEEMPELDKESSDFQSLPEMEEEAMRLVPPATTIPPIIAPAIPEPMPSIPRITPAPERYLREEAELAPSDVYQKTERRLFSPEKRILREIPSGKTIYVRVDNFKATLGNIDIVRRNLRKSGDVLLKMENIKNSKDKSFDKVKSSLDDLQKRLIFIDKTLFKGE